MDPRIDPAQHSWPRSHSQSAAHDARQPAPIPPPPYALQGAPPAVPRPQTFFNNDVFLSRKIDRNGPLPDGKTSKPSFSMGGPMGLQSQYATSLPREAPGPPSITDREQEHQGTWSTFADGRDDRYKPQVIEAPSALPPPPPSAGYRPSLEAFHVSESPARQAGPRTSSPRMYGAAQSSLPPPPPPPAVPYGSRHMRPPSSPQYGPAPSNRDPPSQSPIGRDLPALPANTRPSSSMSISSMLGTEPGRPPREPPVSSHSNGPQSGGSFNSLMQYSTSAGSPTKPNGAGLEHHGSPPSQNAMSGVLNRPFRAYSGGSAGAGKRSSPSTNVLRFGAPPTETPSITQISPRSAGVQERAPAHNRHASAGRMIDRPNSQPAGFNASPIDFDRRAREIDARRAELARQEEEIARNGTGFSDRARNSAFDLLRQQRQEATRQHAQTSTQSSPQDDRLHPSTYPFLSNSSVFTEPSTKGRTEYSYTPRERVVSDEQDSHSLVHKSPFDADALRRLREERLGATTMQQQQDLNRTAPSGGRRFLENLDNRQDPIDNRRLSTVSSAAAMERTRSIDSIGRNSEELNNHRHSLAIMLENSKRGRVSPLPQAVQGAQGRPTNGLSGTPGIKTEFSKVFAGIGSGVSSTGLASGTNTPIPPSPRQSVENEQRPFGPPSDMVKVSESRNGSRMGKRRNKVKEDDVENGDARMSGVPTDGRGIKRVKHSHRHPIHGHHHHRDEGTPLRNVTNPSGSTPTTHHHHHHHHHADGTIHHHHHTHTKPPAAVPEKAHPAPRMPKTIIDNTAIFSLIQNQPRHHLGSTVYAPTASSATSASFTSKVDNMAGSYTIPPQFGKENCTLTIRVPRFYLTHSSLLHTTARRAVWGTGIYTDDSDPLCAAIHAGWIRGAWPDNIDISMLEPGLKNVSLGSDAVDYKETVLDKPPVDGPLIAPLGRDMHITIVILPTLQSYASRVAHGVKSRAWGADHDGLSFQIVTIAFVDEGAWAGEEKSAAARKYRLAGLEREATGLMPFSYKITKLRRPAMTPALQGPSEVVAAA